MISLLLFKFTHQISSKNSKINETNKTLIKKQINTKMNPIAVKPIVIVSEVTETPIKPYKSMLYNVKSIHLF